MILSSILKHVVSSRVGQVAGLFLLSVAALALLVSQASQGRRLVKPRVVTPSGAQHEYVWHSAEPTWAYHVVRPQVERFLEGIPPGARVLDLGCGNGVVLASFRDRGWELVGVDISESGIRQARKRWPGIRFEIADATGDLSALGSFDAVISTEVIEHVFLPRRFAQNAFRALKPGGRFVLSTPYHGWLKNVAIAVTGQSDRHYEPLEDFGHIKFWSPTTLGRLLWETGFDEVEFIGVGRVPYLWKSMVLRAHKPTTSEAAASYQKR